MEGNNNEMTQSDSWAQSNGSKTTEMDLKRTSIDSEEHNKTYGNGKCSRLPMLFERSRFGFFNPRFDSDELERDMEKSFFPSTRRQFKCALFYIMFASLCWVAYTGVRAFLEQSSSWNVYIISFSILFFLTLICYILTFLKAYRRFYFVLSVFYSIVLCVISLFCSGGFSIALDKDFIDCNKMNMPSFCHLVEVVLLLYRLIPLPLYFAAGLSIVYSVLHAALTISYLQRCEGHHDVALDIGHVMLMLCIQLVCISVFIMSSVQKHSTFWRIGQCAIARKQLREEKKLKDEIIHSLMPPEVARKVMKAQNQATQDSDLNLVSTEHEIISSGSLQFLCRVSFMFQELALPVLIAWIFQ